MMIRAHHSDGSSATRRFRLVVPSRVAERPRAIAFVSGLCRTHALDTDVEHALVSAFGEAFNHAVLHGPGGGNVAIEVELTRGQVTVEVRDRGADFASSADGPERRYGLFIMLRAMDEVRWYQEGDENVVVLVKRLPPRQTT